MIMYAVEYEVSLHKDDDTPFAKFTAFDDESFDVKLVAGICSGKDLRDLGDLLDIATDKLREGTVVGLGKKYGQSVNPDDKFSEGGLLVEDMYYDCSICLNGCYDSADGITNCDIDGEDRTRVLKSQCDRFIVERKRSGS